MDSFRNCFGIPTTSGTVTGRLDLHKVPLLVRFLQAFIISRPNVTLRLPDAIKTIIDVTPNDTAMIKVVTATKAYRKAAGASRAKSEETPNCLGLAVIAQLYSLHPLFEMEDLDEELGPITLEDTAVASLGLSDRAGMKKRAAWVSKIRNATDDQLFLNADRLNTLVSLVQQMRTQYPDKKMIVFS
jgi:hypothetical protein